MDRKDITSMKDEELKEFIRKFYGRIASPSCSPGCGTGCCATEDVSEASGYNHQDLTQIPAESNLGLGCGNPLMFAGIKEGNVVLDLGSGAGFDCFIASHKVGEKGKIIGVDMTPEMIKKARRNAVLGNYRNVKFVQGEIENLPLGDNSVDVVISNCVINLSPDKARVFKEAFRVLKPGGRLSVSDVVLEKELPEYIKKDLVAYAGCLSGAVLKNDYLKLIKDAGFEEVAILQEVPYFLDLTSSTEEVQPEAWNLPANKKEAGAVQAVSVLVTSKKPEK